MIPKQYCAKDGEVGLDSDLGIIQSRKSFSTLWVPAEYIQHDLSLHFLHSVKLSQPYILADPCSDWNSQLNWTFGLSMLFQPTLLFWAEINVNTGQFTPACLYLSTQINAETYKLLLHLNSLLTFCSLSVQRHWILPGSHLPGGSRSVLISHFMRQIWTNIQIH